LIFTAALFFIPPIPLGADYHYFSDQRQLFAIPNALNVLSNILFFLVGLWGMFFTVRRASRASFLINAERIPYFVFFSGVMLTGIGSACYHAAPGDARLLYDLLPMSVAFVSLVDAVIVERISVPMGLRLYLPFVLLAAASVLYWHHGESIGHGDLRFYLFIQFFSPVAIATTVCLFPPRYTRTADLFVAFLLFALAKLCELLDERIYSLGRVVSGHTLKHLVAGFSCNWILRMLQRRRAAAKANASEA
jgi:hypothetical protein